MDFYTMPLSAPCRGSLLTAAALGLELNMKPLDLFAGENRTPEFLAINPQHTVPTLVDGDLKLWESRAISAYFVNQYGKDDSLYPKCPKKRAQVDKVLYFDMGLYTRFGNYAYPVMFGGESPKAANLEKFQEGMVFLEGMLKGRDFACGSDVTIADHNLAASVSSFKSAGVVDLSPYTAVLAWLERCEKSMPGYDVNQAGADAFGKLAKSKFDAAAEK